MRIGFRGPIWRWRGPAPFYLVPVPEDDGRYVLPLKGAVRRAEGLAEGDEVGVVLEVW